MRFTTIAPITGLLFLAGVRLSTGWKIEYYSDTHCTSAVTYTQSGSGEQCVQVLKENIAPDGSVKYTGGPALGFTDADCNTPADPNSGSDPISSGDCFGVLNDFYIDTS